MSCAPSIFNSFAGIGTIEHQPHFVPVTRRALMAAVNTTSRALGLRPSSVVVLDALLSCLPCNDPKTGNDSPITPLTLLTVFACNDTLCFRAKGITDRQLRRHLEKLEAANLIQRRDSSNGKRFPIMRNGKVIGAFRHRPVAPARTVWRNPCTVSETSSGSRRTSRHESLHPKTAR